MVVRMIKIGAAINPAVSHSPKMSRWTFESLQSQCPIFERKTNNFYLRFYRWLFWKISTHIILIKFSSRRCSAKRFQNIFQLFRWICKSKRSDFLYAIENQITSPWFLMHLYLQLARSWSCWNSLGESLSHCDCLLEAICGFD